MAHKWRIHLLVVYVNQLRGLVCVLETPSPGLFHSTEIQVDGMGLGYVLQQSSSRMQGQQSIRAEKHVANVF